MDTKQFLQTVLGDDGFYCVAGIRKNGSIIQKFYESLDDVIMAAGQLDENKINAYYGLSTFETPENRTADNAKQVRSFFLDIDCGFEKPYRNQEEGLVALKNFCKTMSLPRPTIVNSGNGLHVYWPLKEAVTRDEWFPVASRLKAACISKSFKVDLAVPADAARILRVPNTNNHKSDSAKEVKLVGAPAEANTLEFFIDKFSDEHIGAMLSRPYIPKGVDEVTEIIAGSYKSNFQEILKKSQEGEGCSIIKFAFEEQDKISEPIWRGVLSIASFCEDRDWAIHAISDQHSDYSAELTEEKASRVKGPYRCTTLNNENPGFCESCPNWGKINSPIRLGRHVKEAEDNAVVEEKLADIPSAKTQTFVIPKYPEPYFRGENGGIFQRVYEKDSVKEVPVYHNDLYVTRRLRDAELGECCVLRLHLPKDGVREFTMPLTILGSKEELRRILAMHGAAIIKVDTIMDYLSKWVNNLQLQSAADDARLQFGWTNDDTLESFVVGNMELFKDRVQINSPSSRTVDLFPAFVPKGSLEEWKKTMQFFGQEGMELHQFMIGLAFGSPLMPFFESINGVALHIHSSDSGYGKTTAMLAGASVWGDPDKIMLQERDTYASKMNRAEIYKNLPLYLDEMTNTAPKDLSDFAYQLPSGYQRNRLSGKGNIERKRGEPWKLLCGSTGNTSILGRINLYKALPKAEAQRILEREAKNVSFASKEETDELSRRISRNYGHAGPEYIKYLLNNLDECKTLSLSTQKKLDEAANLNKQNRFWSVLAAATVSGILIAKKAGLLDWQVAPIVKWAIASMDIARDNIDGLGGDVESILNDYWAENYNNILRIKSTDDARKGPTGLEHLITPEATPRFQLVARYEYDVKKLYLLPKPLKEWCGKQQINYSGFVENLKTGRTAAYSTKMRLGTGTHINLPPASVWVIDCSGFLNEEAEEKIAETAATRQKQSKV